MKLRDTLFPTISGLVRQIKLLARRNSHDFSQAAERDGLNGQLEYVIAQAYPNLNAGAVKEQALLEEIGRRLNEAKPKDTDFRQTTLDGAGFEPVIYAPPYFRDEQGNWQPRNKLSLAELLSRSEVRVQQRRDALEIAVAQHTAIRAAYDEALRRGLDPEHVYCKPPSDLGDEDEAAEE